ncbi:hypothetical protein UY3_13101 [Chelonia mydas]|uniref:Uncharacterized protein n=1 Tax=Chelonia mydas TaxID=8469 RepID=M7BC61_CHEMY|nr:hypothetical protein UY3_13101 [Chelonia mydas]
MGAAESGGQWTMLNDFSSPASGDRQHQWRMQYYQNQRVIFETKSNDRSSHWPGAANRGHWEPRSAERADTADKHTDPLSLHKRQNKFGNHCYREIFLSESQVWRLGTVTGKVTDFPQLPLARNGEMQLLGAASGHIRERSGLNFCRTTEPDTVQTCGELEEFFH